MIHAKHVCKQFGRFLAVDSLNLEIPRGSVVGFLGPNGAGKTTTIRMMSGYLPPTSGHITVDGLDVSTHWRDVRRRIGYLPEAAPSYTEMRVEEFLVFRARMFGLTRSQRKPAVQLAMDRCWLTAVRRKPIYQLSKGYRQRVGLAAALLHEPPLLILDEPTVGLDPTQIREMRTLIRELAGQHTILLSTHILPEVEVTCDRIVMIARGRVRADGTIEELQTMAARTCRYIVEVSSDRVGDALASLPEITHVESTSLDGRWCRYTLTATPAAGDQREAIAAAVAGADRTVRELHRVTPSLEQLFVQMAAEAETDFAMRQAKAHQNHAQPVDEVAA
jgi:ABC-2 type transport system ATP-binding protein